MSNRVSGRSLKTRLRTQWTAAAENWFNQDQSVRTGMLDAWMLDALGDVDGREVLDIGCGDGRFCRLLAGLGAHVTGIDVTDAFIDRARHLASRGETYLVGDAEQLAELDDATFDLAVSYIVLVDLFDMDSAVAAAYRVLRTGGRFVVCNIHPIRSSLSDGWVKRGDDKLFYPVDNYTVEGPREWRVWGAPFINMHRSLSRHIDAFLGSGFKLTALREPTPTPAQLAANPTFDDEFRAPNFIIYELAKVAG